MEYIHISIVQGTISNVRLEHRVGILNNWKDLIISLSEARFEYYIYLESPQDLAQWLQHRR